MLKRTLYRFLIELTNHKLTSKLLMKFSQSSLSKSIIPSYSKAYKLNWSEVERNQKDFGTLHELFIRKLKQGTRPIQEGEHVVCSPVDAVYEESGTIAADASITVKGKDYSIEEMLGDHDVLQKYIGGTYVLLYLSPSHYHRIHAPITGEVVRRWSLGKNSYPVNHMGMKYGKAPLSKNYRLVTELKHAMGSIAVVKVGAMFVNSIEITNESSHLIKGEEFSYFSFGSTIVLLFEKNTFKLNASLIPHSEVKYGEALGEIKVNQIL